MKFPKLSITIPQIWKFQATLPPEALLYLSHTLVNDLIVIRVSCPANFPKSINSNRRRRKNQRSTLITSKLAKCTTWLMLCVILWWPPIIQAFFLTLFKTWLHFSTTLWFKILCLLRMIARKRSNAVRSVEPFQSISQCSVFHLS